MRLLSSRIVDHDVQAAQLFNCFADQLGTKCSITKVARQSNSVAARIPDQPNDFLSIWLFGLAFFLRLGTAMQVGAGILSDRQVLTWLWLLPIRDAIGYLDQSYDDPAFKEIKGLGARAQLEWFPTQITTVSLTAERQVLDSGIPGAAGYISSTIAAQVDELQAALLGLLIHSFRYSRRRRVCVRLTGISVAFSSFILRM